MVLRIFSDRLVALNAKERREGEKPSALRRWVCYGFRGIEITSSMISRNEKRSN